MSNIIATPPRLLGVAHPSPPTLKLPLMPVRVTCGFPSPSEDFFGPEDLLDLNKRCISNPTSTFFMEADTGESMTGFGIYPGDTLVIDRSIAPCSGDIVIALWEGGFTCKQLRLCNGHYELRASPGFRPLVVPSDVELEVWGVVSWSMRRHLRR